ncbi:MAG: enoyl-CoA hydratase-related protein [Thermodesulfobacteriota bacterium]
MAKFEDIKYSKRKGRAVITINRPKVLNAFRAQTLYEMIEAVTDAWKDNSVGVVVLTGAGDEAFSTGGDQKAKKQPKGSKNLLGVGAYVAKLHYLIRNIPKPVIAAVKGYAIGGGNVLQVVCDLTIAADNAVFGQVGPRVGSVDAGFGTAYLSRIVGEKKAREMWYLCRKYGAEEALDMGLVNVVVPKAKLDAEVNRWCDEIIDKSPTALKVAKYSFNADTDSIFGISRMGLSSLELFHTTEESKEGVEAFIEKREVDFGKFRK